MSGNEVDVSPGVHRVLVGLDGSDDSRRAARWARLIAERFGAELVGAHAVGLLDVWPDDDHRPLRRNSHERVRALLDGAWSEPLRGARVPLRLEMRDGPPAATLLALAVDVGADLIVVGSRGAGETPAGSLGSTSAKLVQHSAVPVTVVPPPHIVDDTWP